MTTTRTITSAVSMAVLAAASACVLASPASAATGDAPWTGPAAATRRALGSIVYVKGFNVWIARGDGTGQRQLTHDGSRSKGYFSPSEADNGTIAAARGPLIVRLSHNGAVLNRIDPPALKNSAGESMDGPVTQVALSPDGKTVAYSFVRPSCPVGGDCQYRYATGYTAADHLSTAGGSTFFHDPSWIGSGRTLQSGGYGSQVQLQDVKAAPRYWFDDRDYAGSNDTDLADGELSPDGRQLVEIRGYGENTSVLWYSVTGNAKSGLPPAVPTPACLTGTGPGKTSPTWSPDSTALAWGTPDGIWITKDAVHCGAQNAVLKIKGGATPDWSRAAL